MVQNVDRTKRPEFGAEDDGRKTGPSKPKLRRERIGETRMADAIPSLNLDYNSAGDPIVIVAERTELSDVSQILKTVPALADPKLAIAYAQVVNHLAQGDRFEVIADPAAFKAEFMAKWQAEDPEAEPVQGVQRLRDFGIPDFAAITPPKVEGGQLTFFAVNTYMGLPYRATLVAGSKVDYAPVAIVE